MNKSATIKKAFKGYSLKDGKIKMKDGKKYSDILFIGCDDTSFIFLDKHVTVGRVDPTEIAEFLANQVPKEAI